MAIGELLKYLNSPNLSDYRQIIIDFSMIQIEEYKANPERGEKIAYGIAGLMSTKALESAFVSFSA